MQGRLGVAEQRKVLSQGNAVLEKFQGPHFNAYDRPYADLREFIARSESAGEVGPRRPLEARDGRAGRNRQSRPPEPPANHKEVPGYGKEMRLLSGATDSSKRLAIALGLPVPDDPLDVVRAYRERMKTARSRPRPWRGAAAAQEREPQQRGRRAKFPARPARARRRALYGTEHLVIMRDPEADWVNGGTCTGRGACSRNHVSL